MFRRMALDKSVRWKVHNCFVSEPQIPCRGVLQGCALSVVAFNIIMMPLIKRLERIDGLRVASFADDLMIYSQLPDLIQEGLSCVEQFAGVIGLPINLDKCTSWSVGQVNPQRNPFLLSSWATKL
eukprot:6492789-Amphidinium_carterae.1